MTDAKDWGKDKAKEKETKDKEKAKEEEEETREGGPTTRWGGKE